MIVPGSANSLLLRSAGVTAYQVERSLRFNSADSAYLSRTPASAGNRKTWTWSGWIKRSGIGGTDAVSVFQARVSNTQIAGIVINPGGDIFFQDYNLSSSYNTTWTTNAVYRDPSAWYHLVVVCDFTQASSGNAVKIYVNGAEQTLTFSVNGGGPYTQNRDTYINSTIQHAIGLREDVKYLNAYLADIHFIDGQALTPSSFAETNATTGQWVPKAYTGTYGTNGFRLAFADNSNNTATTLGKDSSPNGNNWTPNNLSVTAGAGNDSLVDTPTSYGSDTGAGGEVRGNYTVLNALAGGGTIANGNLDFLGASGGAQRYGTIGVASGKWYWEVTVTAGSGGTLPLVGIGNNPNQGGLVGIFGYYGFNGNKYADSTATAYGASYGANDVVSVAFDADNGTLTFYKNGTTQGQAFSGITGTYFPLLRADTGTSVVANFGQRPFAYTAPSGFKALCDTNLPAPVVAKPNSVFDVALWTGNGSARSITGLNFNPDFVWIKGRSGATDHALYDVVRGTEKRLESNTTDAEVTSDGGVTAFNSDGFSLGTLAQVNTNSSTYVGWAWDAGSSTATNTQGSITSQVRANASAGFSIVTYTGNGTSGATVGHGLGVAPGLIIVKQRSTASANGNWAVQHQSLGATKALILSATDAADTSAGYWNNTSPTSSVFSVGTFEVTNRSTATYVAYCFAPVAGYSSFGSYTGNGSATDGPFVFCGLRPRWLLLKNTNQVTNWYLVDAARNTYNVVNSLLRPNLSNAELSGVVPVDFLSNGFKIRDNDAGSNASGQTIVWAAFAENPFQYARAR